MKIKHVSAIFLSGAVWFGVGMMLLSKGFGFILQSTLSERWVSLLIISAILIGYLKGRYVLAKSAKRIVQRIRSLPSPLKLHTIYPRQYYFVLLGMVALGLSLKWLPFRVDIRGFIDIAIGSALMNGGIVYFREALSVRKQRSSN